MLIDLLACVLFIIAIFKGWRKGLIVALASFIALVIGLAAAVKLSAAMASYIGENVTVSQRWLPFIAFMVVFLIIVLLIRLGARLVQSAVQAAMLGWVNKFGGVLLYALIYLFVYSVLLFYTTKLGIIKSATVQASVTYGFIAPFGPKVIDGLGVIIPFFRDMFTDLLEFFDAVQAPAPPLPKRGTTGMAVPYSVWQNALF